MNAAPALSDGFEHDYVLFDPAPWHFPPPLLPVLPVLRQGALGASPERPLWAARGHRLYSKARYALRDALAVCGVGPQGGFLAPAYHCRTMIDPAIALGARFDLFKLTPRLCPDLDHVAEMFLRAPVPVRAVLMPHYFGLMQDLKPLADLCKRQGAQLIEDCAHALPLDSAETGMGRVGDWCISSPYKFFACPDGGVLWSGTGRPVPRELPTLRRPGLRAEVGQVMRMRAQSRKSLPVRVAAGQAFAQATTAVEVSSLAVQARLRGPSADYRSSDERLACAASTRWLLARTDIHRLLARRRDHYRAWAEAAQGFQSARAFAPELGRHDTPYMFPLLMDAPVEQFARIKRAGVPVYRWDSLASSGCDVSARCRLQLLHLPCHQALRPGDLTWMIETVRACLDGVSSERQA